MCGCRVIEVVSGESSEGLVVVGGVLGGCESVWNWLVELGLGVEKLVERSECVVMELLVG